MTQPDEAVYQAQQPQEEKVQIDPKVKEYFETDPRERIWKKYNEMTRGKEPQAPQEEGLVEVPAPEPATGEQPETAEPVPEAASAPPPEEPEGDEILTRDEYEKRFAKVKVKAKFAGEEAVVPASELVKITGLEKHLQKRLTEVNQREKELLEKQFAVPDPMTAAAYPPPPAPDAYQRAPMGTALEHLSDTQVRERYNELAMESPFDATAFLEQVRSARQNATARMHRNKAELAQKNFLSTYGLSEDSPEWQRINDRGFYEKHPDILRARDRGDYDSMFATALLHLQREKFDNERAEFEKRVQSDQAKNESKKKGQVLRATTKPEPQKPVERKVETPEEYIRRVAQERRELQRIRLPKPR